MHGPHGQILHVRTTLVSIGASLQKVSTRKPLYRLSELIRYRQTSIAVNACPMMARPSAAFGFLRGLAQANRTQFVCENSPILRASFNSAASAQAKIVEKKDAIAPTKEVAKGGRKRSRFVLLRRCWNWHLMSHKIPDESTKILQGPIEPQPTPTSIRPFIQSLCPRTIHSRTFGGSLLRHIEVRHHDNDLHPSCSRRRENQKARTFKILG